jgi:hypothetical protein
MTKTVASLAVVLALGVLASKAEAQPYPPERVAWMVGPGYFGISGIPWPGPPYAWPVLRPTLGCYFTEARLKGAWRRVEVCS